MVSEVYLLLFLFFSQAVALDLVIIDVPDQIDHELISVPYEYTNINMHEEMDVPLTLGYFIYDGPVVGFSFSIPSPRANDNLGLDIRRNESNIWELIIHDKQDYESDFFSSPNHQYFFLITAGGDIAEVMLNLVNINDNFPFVIPNSPSCKIQEEWLGLTDCTYNITDRDGHMQDFAWSLSNDGAEFFEFIYEPPVTSYTVTQATLVLRTIQKLNYEEAAEHITDLTVVDRPLVEGDKTNAGTARVVVEVIRISNMKCGQLRLVGSGRVGTAQRNIVK